MLTKPSTELYKCYSSRWRCRWALFSGQTPWCMWLCGSFCAPRLPVWGCFEHADMCMKLHLLAVTVYQWHTNNLVKYVDIGMAHVCQICIEIFFISCANFFPCLSESLLETPVLVIRSPGKQNGWGADSLWCLAICNWIFIPVYLFLAMKIKELVCWHLLLHRS